LNESRVTVPLAQRDLGVLLGLGAAAPAPGYLPEFDAPLAPEEMSVIGVMLLTAMAVVMAILGVVFLGVFLIVTWWVISHIPVPLAVTELIAKLGI
jgi:hypothetical protein